MSLENIYYIGQTIAVVAILATLIGLIIQMRSATQLARKTAIQDQLDKLERLPRALFETPGLADIYVRGVKDIEALTDSERMIYLAFWRSSLRIWEGIYTQYLDGDIDPETWETYRKQLRGETTAPGADVAGKKLRRFHTHSKQFLDLLDGLREESIALKAERMTTSEPKPDNETET